MRKLRKPLDDSRAVFLTCISRVRNPDLRSRLESIQNSIVTASQDFDIAASTNSLHTLSTQNDIDGIITQQEMSDVYTNRMAKKGAPGRVFYDQLLAVPEHGRCPLCGQRVVSTLDHHLPKKHYPALSVVLTNLVPACADCNKTKIDIIPGNSGEETIHPYFDDVDTDMWLYAKVFETSPAVILFYVNPPENWNATKTRRLKHHFKLFKLSSLYSSQAATELINIRDRLSDLFDEAGDLAVREHLRDEARSRESAYLNSWQTAMYRALANSEWYCLGGFRS